MEPVLRNFAEGVQHLSMLDAEPLDHHAYWFIEVEIYDPYDFQLADEFSNVVSKENSKGW